MRKFVVGVMGAGENADEQDLRNALRLGELIAGEGWVLLTGGRGVGVMDAVNRGAKQVEGSLTVGILPNARVAVSEFVDVAIVTDMGDARNNINVLSSNVVVACGAGSAGTASEIALAMKAGKTVILLCAGEESRSFFERLGKRQVLTAADPEGVIGLIQAIRGKA